MIAHAFLCKGKIIKYDGKTKPSTVTASNAVMKLRLPCYLIRGFIFPRRVLTRVQAEVHITKPFSSTLVIAREVNRLPRIFVLSLLSLSWFFAFSAVSGLHLPVPNRGSPRARHRKVDLTRHSKERLQAQRQNQAQRQTLLAQRCATTQRKISQTSVLAYMADYGWDGRITTQHSPNFNCHPGLPQKRKVFTKDCRTGTGTRHIYKKPR